MIGNIHQRIYDLSTPTNGRPSQSTSGGKKKKTREEKGGGGETGGMMDDGCRRGEAVETLLEASEAQGSSLNAPGDPSCGLPLLPSDRSITDGRHTSGEKKSGLREGVGTMDHMNRLEIQT